MGGLNWLDFFGRKEKPVTRLAEHAELASRIVLNYYCQMHLIVEVLLERLDHSHFPLQSHIHNIGGFLRPKPDAAPFPELNAKDSNALGGGFLCKWIPIAAHNLS
jgi:hypothetical protein